MNFEQLIEEGRRLQRFCMFLRPQESGPMVAMWHARDEREIEETGHHCWLTVDARYIPNLTSPIAGYISIFTNEASCEGGRVEIAPSWPSRKGIPLYAHVVPVLPPIDAVFARGSNAVEEWITSHGWDRTCRYNDNFKDRDVVDKYDRVWMSEFPLYIESDIYAVLGGWHFPCSDDDWHDLIDEKLMVMTIRDSEPWVEAWRMRDGRFNVIQRIT